MIKGRIQDALVVIGAIIQLVGFVTYFKDITTNPVYALAILLAGYALIVYYCLYQLFKIAPNTTADMTTTSAGTPTGMPTGTSTAMPPGTPRQSPSSGKKRKRIVLAVLSFSTVLTLILGFTVIKRNRTPVADSPLVQIGEMQDRTADFKFIKINKISWTGGGAYAIIDSSQYPLAKIQDPSQLKQMSVFTGTACAVEFEAEPRSDIDRVTIDTVEAIVADYEPLPRYKPVFPKPFQEENILYIEIDNPATSMTHSFASSLRINKGVVEPFGTLFLEKGKPETFVVRINARQPGIYTIECRLKIRVKDKAETVSITNPSKWLFDY
jgi:hypothetical protein